MSTSKEREYTSPDYKLIACFRKSRDAWKEKAQAAQRRVGKLKERLKHVRARRDEWKAAAQATRAEVAGTVKKASLRSRCGPR